MAQNVIINGVTYSNVPEVDIPHLQIPMERYLMESDTRTATGSIQAVRYQAGRICL